MNTLKFAAAAAAAAATACATAAEKPAATNDVADLGTVLVEGSAISRYRPETVNGGTFTDVPPEELPVAVDVLTEDFMREHNPTDLHDLMRFVPGIETGGKSLLIRNPGTFSIRGMGGTEPAIDGVLPIGRGAGLFTDPFLLERVEIVKGPVGGLSGGAGASQNASGGGGSVNMYLKSARFDVDETNVQGSMSAGRHLWRTRGLFDVNQTEFDGRLAVRVPVTADLYSPAYISQGSQKGARPRESYALAPSFAVKAGESVTFGLKTMFQYTDQPGYIGVPVYRGRPADGWSWRESSCRRGDRAVYKSFMLNPWVDWQVNEYWLLKFGAGMMFSDWEFSMREPYFNNAQAAQYFAAGRWPGGGKYMVSTFSEGSSVSRNYNVYTRSIYTRELPWQGIENTFVAQPDWNWRESSGGFGTPTARYGLLLQDSVKWGWFTVLGGVRYDHFEQQAYTSGAVRYAHMAADAVSPRGGITVRPVDWLAVFGNISQTRTPMLGLRNADGSTPTSPWRATQYEAGVRVSPADKLWLSVSAYRIEQENVPQADASGFYWYDGRNTSRGAEVSLTGDIAENWTVMGMYALNMYTDRNVAPGTKGRDFERYPENSFSLSTSYRFTRGWMEDVVVGGCYRFRSKSYGTMRGAFVDENIFYAPSHVVDLSVSMPLSKFGGSKDWTLSFGVRNLTGEKYFESARHFYESLAGEPRTFEIGIRGRF